MDIERNNIQPMPSLFYDKLAQTSSAMILKPNSTGSTGGLTCHMGQ